MKLKVKKILLFFLFFSVLLLVAFNLAEARQGCCSWHGGVCGCGCCDGTPLSATCAPYYPECGGGYYSYPSYPSTPSCPAMSSYNSLSGSCECYAGYVVDRNILGNESCISGDQKCHNDYGYNSRYNSLTKNCECDYGYTMSGGTCISQNQLCKNQLGLFSSYNSLNGMCQCDSGYVISNGQCIDGDTLCHSEIGIYSDYNSLSNKCECNSDYFFDGSQCVTVGISNIYPTNARVGDEVIVKGENFGNDKYGNFDLYVGSTKVSKSDISRWENERIVFIVGDYIDSGYIKVKDSYYIDARGPYLEIVETPKETLVFTPAPEPIPQKTPEPIPKPNSQIESQSKQVVTQDIEVGQKEERGVEASIVATTTATTTEEKGAAPSDITTKGENSIIKIFNGFKEFFKRIFSKIF